MIYSEEASTMAAANDRVSFRKIGNGVYQVVGGVRRSATTGQYVTDGSRSVSVAEAKYQVVGTAVAERYTAESSRNPGK